MKKQTFLILVICIVSINLFAQETGTFIDKRDGHEYKWVRIGNQKWMAENLNYKINENTVRSPINVGMFYTWSEAQTVCPMGWHLPSSTEWKELVENLGGIENAGAKLKSISSLWRAPKIQGNNRSKFNALPGGYLFWISNNIYRQWHTAYFWTSSKIVGVSIEGDSNGVVITDWEQGRGYSVRCLKN